MQASFCGKCEKALVGFTPKCSECALLYCSAKCKKNDRKDHKKECLRRRGEFEMELLPVVFDDGKKSALLLEPDVRELYYPDYKANETRISVVRSEKTGELFLSPSTETILELFEEICAKYSDSIRNIFHQVGDERKNGFVQLYFTDFTHFARAILDENLPAGFALFDDDTPREVIEQTTEEMGFVWLKIRYPDPNNYILPDGKIKYNINRLKGFII